MDSLSVSWSNSSFWGTFWGQLWVDILGGIIGAFVFLFIVLWFFRPKINIASFLCKIPHNGKNYYHFKFVNASIFDAHDVKIELHEIKKIPMGGGQYNNTYKKLELLNSEVAYLPRKPMSWARRDDHPHCMIVRTLNDIDGIVSDENSAVLIRISLKHGLTGLSNVFEQDYANTNDIKPYKYKPGPKFDVI